MNNESKAPIQHLTNGGNNVYDVVHWYNIKVINRKREIVEFLSWTGLKWQLRLKYDWYFKYRSALLQVKYPRFEVQTYWGHEPATGKTLEEIRQSKIKAKKAKITEYKNKIEKARKNWQNIFPIEDDTYFQKAIEKIKRLEFEVKSL